jgi:hypothetical protein
MNIKIVGFFVVALLLSLIALPKASALEITALEIIQQVNDRDEGEHLTRDMNIELIDRHGNKRVQKTKTFRQFFGSTKKTVIFYTDPSNIKDTAFLTWDFQELDRDDEQWLYLPAFRKVRRVSASDSGDYFLGTDFTYEEIKKESKISEENYTFSLLGEERLNDRAVWVIEAIPVDNSVVEIYGFSKVLLKVDQEILMPRHTSYWDESGNYLKKVEIPKVKKIDGIWSIEEIHVSNEKTGHTTIMKFANADYQTPIAKRLFQSNTLTRGF